MKQGEELLFFPADCTKHREEYFMYVRENRGWTKHMDFMVLDLVILELVYFLAYVLRHGFGIYSVIYKELGLAIVVFHFLLVFFYGNLSGYLAQRPSERIEIRH